MLAKKTSVKYFRLRKQYLQNSFELLKLTSIEAGFGLSLHTLQITK